MGLKHALLWLTLVLIAPAQGADSSMDAPLVLSDTQGYDVGRYLSAVTNKVRLNWFSVMPEAARKGEKGRVVVLFTIMRDGKVTDQSVVLSSGNQTLDRAALAAVELSSPFVALPADFKPERMVLRYSFRYNIKAEER